MTRVIIGHINYPDDPNNSGDSTNDEALAAHVISPTPHPTYDDPMGLITYFENGLA